MKKQYTENSDLPPRNHPDYMRLYNAKYRERLKEYREERKRKNPDYNKQVYERNRDKKLSQNKEYRKTNKAMLRERAWKALGIIDLTYEIYEEAIQRQGGKCAICFRELIKPQADHDHSTGEFRGVLCVPCNNGLGIYELNREAYERYLKK